MLDLSDIYTDISLRRGAHLYVMVVCQSNQLSSFSLVHSPINVFVHFHYRKRSRKRIILID